MVIFNGYVNLPEGIIHDIPYKSPWLGGYYHPSLGKPVVCFVALPSDPSWGLRTWISVQFPIAITWLMVING